MNQAEKIQLKAQLSGLAAIAGKASGLTTAGLAAPIMTSMGPAVAPGLPQAAAGMAQMNAALEQLIAIVGKIVDAS